MSEEISEDMKEMNAQLESYQDSDGACPNCKSSNTSKDDFDDYEGVVEFTREAECLDCGARWTEGFEMIWVEKPRMPDEDDY